MKQKIALNLYERWLIPAGDLYVTVCSYQLLIYLTTRRLATCSFWINIVRILVTTIKQNLWSRPDSKNSRYGRGRCICDEIVESGADYPICVWFSLTGGDVWWKDIYFVESPSAKCEIWYFEPSIDLIDIQTQHSILVISAHGLPGPLLPLTLNLRTPRQEFISLYLTTVIFLATCKPAI